MSPIRWAGVLLRQVRLPTYRASPLRVRLVMVLTLLVAAALAGSGVAAAATMNHFLIGQVDAQLRGASGLLAQNPDGAGAAGMGDLTPQSTSRPVAESGDDDDHEPLPSAYVTETTDAAGAVVSGPSSNLIDPDQPLPALPGITAAHSHGYGPRFLTVGAVEGDELWRVLTEPITLSDGAPGTLLIAQSLRGVQDTVDRLVALLLIIGLTALTVVTGIGYLVVRASMRPLRAVEHAAAAITAGDLARRVPDADPRTEVGHLAEALNTMLDRIESAEERMRRFVGDASHELRTPLTTIRGFAELFRQGGATRGPELDRLMRRIEDEAARMGLLVQDLLLLARLDQERPLARTPVDMLALAGDAVLDARAVAPGRPIRLRVADSDPPPIVTGDEPRLRQVLSNLLTNALHHTAAGTPVTVTVGTGQGAHSEGPAVIITVADQGPGLSAEAAGRVFERFYRADTSRNRRDGGTGLGLAIVAALTASHGGHVEVTSQPGAGTCFRLELPLADTSTGAARGPLPTAARE